VTLAAADFVWNAGLSAFVAEVGTYDDGDELQAWWAYAASGDFLNHLTDNIGTLSITETADPNLGDGFAFGNGMLISDTTTYPTALLSAPEGDPIVFSPIRLTGPTTVYLTALGTEMTPPDTGHVTVNILKATVA